MMVGRKVVVTTEFRGVFFGTLTELDLNARVCTLIDARNCVYWSSSVKGFLGLAATGPNDESRIGPAVERLDLVGVTSVSPASDEAAAKWEAAPWS